MIRFEGLNSLIHLADMIERDFRLLDTILDEGPFLDELREIIAENFESIFDSQGASIGSDWDGNTLVDTGRLKASLTQPGLLRIQLFDDAIVFGTDVPYAEYVDDRYGLMGIETETFYQIGELITRYMQQRGELDWS